MELQTAFYIIGIAAMVLWIAIFIVVITVVMQIRSSIKSFQTGFKSKVVSLVKDRNVEIASALGLSVANFVINKMRSNSKKSGRGN